MEVRDGKLVDICQRRHDVNESSKWLLFRSQERFGLIDRYFLRVQVSELLLFREAKVPSERYILTDPIFPVKKFSQVSLE